MDPQAQDAYQFWLELPPPAARQAPEQDPSAPSTGRDPFAEDGFPEGALPDYSSEEAGPPPDDDLDDGSGQAPYLLHVHAADHDHDHELPGTGTPGTWGVLVQAYGRENTYDYDLDEELEEPDPDADIRVAPYDERVVVTLWPAGDSAVPVGAYFVESRLRSQYEGPYLLD